jgi:ABC-type dipeptide/oligopeptide/nickel transport system permease subunit
VLDPRTRARLVRSPSAVAGAVIIGALVLFSGVGPWFASHGPLESDFVHGISASGTPVGPGARFPLGADHLFRDVFARLSVAGRLSLYIAVTSTGIASSAGALVGVVCGWYEGRKARIPWSALAGFAAALLLGAWGRPWLAALALAGGASAGLAGLRSGPLVDVDGWLMRLVDAVLAFPFLLLVMALGAALETTSATTILVILGVTGWLGTARVIRAKTLQIRSFEYVEAARALGAPTPAVIVRHVLPNVAGTWVVTATVLAAQMIVADSVLGYLGVGISPPTPTWGRMLYEGQDDLGTAPWLVAAPGAAIVLAVWGFNMLGDGLRDALDAAET